ncbi:hypothetical protein NDU88_005198 [Pleurodeles waltl]|uniref:Uncharacterized protein n=1 Tax=Pleurodeles waltl TaxID=8319 RepID=A0AAV7VKT8_PLEWA|nr:hypothetical protein NDU88_005198 [Pleurodeles waltl]
MPGGKSVKGTSCGQPKDNTVTSLWQKTPPSPMDSSITQAYMDKFLQEMRPEICSLKLEVKVFIHKLKQEVNKLGWHVDGLEHTVGPRTEDQEALRCYVASLEEQQIKLQLKQQDLENRSRRKNIRLENS